ncbi:MAG: DUF2520 domain-containing protein [Dehalococcoidales bacterium]|nr:DUF2520 domain-containing protein [Dehalococcoidales bacterium]
MLEIGFIGAGTVGTALATRLSQKGARITAASSRNLISAERLASSLPHCHAYSSPQEVADVAELIFITTPDDAIAEVANEVHWHPGESVVHCSGAHSLDILKPANQAGANVGSFHPLQTFADINQAVENLPGSTFAIEAEGPLLSTLKELTSLLDGNWIELKPGDKVVYHAAAVFACNYMVTLVELATDLWQTLGVPQKEATKALIPLLRGTVNNINNIGLPDCLTGPISRGDLGTISKHLTALKDKNPSLLAAYKQLGLHTIPIALGKGKINEHKAEELKALFTNSKGGSQ